MAGFELIYDPDSRSMEDGERQERQERLEEKRLERLREYDRRERELERDRHREVRVLEDTFGSGEAMEKNAAPEQLEAKILSEKIKVMERLQKEARESGNFGMADYFKDRIAEFREELNDMPTKQPEQSAARDAQSRMESFSRLQQEATAAGKTEMADYYGGLIEQIRSVIKGFEPTTTETGHQGKQLEQVENSENPGAYQGKRMEQIFYPGDIVPTSPESTEPEEIKARFRSSNEVSFGNSDIKRAEAKMREARTDSDMYLEHVKSDIRFNRDPSSNKSDLKYAQKRYADAVKEYNYLVKKSQKG